ncbi:MAG: FG-GAP-like repeat-containing protein [Planctomycetota bacterium]
MKPIRPISLSIVCQVSLGILAVLAVGCEPKSNQPSSSNPQKPATANESQKEGTKKATSLRALKLLEAGRFDEAWDECQKVLLATPSDSRAIYVSAQVLSQRNKLEQALSMIDRIAIADPEYGILAHRQALAWCQSRFMLQSAEQRALKILQRKADDYETIKLLAALLDLQGRRFESSVLLQKLLSLGATDLTTMVLALDTVKPIASDEIAQKQIEQNPKELRLKGSIAFGALYEKKPDQAEAIFREIIQSGQATPAYWIGLALSLIDQEKWDQLGDWYKQVPRESLENFPEYWRAMGLWCQHLNKHTEAAKCFTRSLELDPMNPLAAGNLAQTLAILGENTAAQRAEAIFHETQLANRNLNYCRDGNRRSEWILQIADTLESRGRVLESILWRELDQRTHNPSGTTIRELEAKRNSLVKSVLPSLKSGVDKPSKEYPEIDWNAILETKTLDKPTNRIETQGYGTVQAKLSWSDISKELQADVIYRNGDDPNVPGMQTYQSNGAGAGVIDYDLDGWPDLFVLQGGGDPREPASNDPNVLLRNIAGKRFENVATQACVNQRAYGQGVAVGDWDQDGLADMFVLNFGENRLLRNQGDGTFEAIPVDSMRRDIANQPVWSVSGAIADIDGDHLPDLVEINYASGIDVITHLCISRENIPQVCRPTEFPASEDYIYISDGQGGFKLANQTWNLQMQDGRGLGVIVGNLDRMHGNDIYIANDMSANNLYLSAQNPNLQGRFVLADEALRRGCAVDNSGKPQASMGVACSDFDRNGTLDLFMTNFIDEYNALYLQSQSNFFVDASRRYRLIDPKKKTLGFGAQSLDIDCDGWQDLLVVNGHVDDFRSKGQPYTMRPQVFLQREASFAEQPNDSLGDFFNKEYLSRSLGLWDFNRDGLVDSYITHLDHPLSVLRNQTKTNGTWIAIELIGTESERDAIGATIKIVAGDQSWIHQRLAGNGFECTNEGFVHLGLGGIQKIDSMEIVWPSGKTSQWENLQVNRRYRAIEAQSILDEVRLVNAPQNQ